MELGNIKRGTGCLGEKGEYLVKILNNLKKAVLKVFWGIICTILSN
jgi:hypothetical protein